MTSRNVLSVGESPTFHIFNKLLVYDIHKLQRDNLDFCFRDAFGNVIVKVEILGIVRKIFTAASGDFQVITVDDSTECIECTVGKGIITSTEFSDLGPPFRRLLSLVHQPGMRIGHTVRVRGTVISSSYWAHKGFHRIRASDIYIHMDPNVTADWILEVLHNQENILNRKLTATREKETGLKMEYSEIWSRLQLHLNKDKPHCLLPSDLDFLDDSSFLSVGWKDFTDWLLSKGLAYQNTSGSLVIVHTDGDLRGLVNGLLNHPKTSSEIGSMIRKIPAYHTMTDHAMVHLLLIMETDSSIYSYENDRKQTIFKSVS